MNLSIFLKICSCYYAQIVFSSQHDLVLHRLMYKKSSSFVYIFVVNHQFFKYCQFLETWLFRYMSICLLPRKFYVRRNNNKVNFIETGCIVIALFLPWSDLEKCMYVTCLYLMMIKFCRHYLIYKYDFPCSLFWMTCKLTKYRKII